MPIWSIDFKGCYIISVMEKKIPELFTSISGNCTLVIAENSSSLALPEHC